MLVDVHVGAAGPATALELDVLARRSLFVAAWLRQQSGGTAPTAPTVTAAAPQQPEPARAASETAQAMPLRLMLSSHGDDGVDALFAHVWRLLGEPATVHDTADDIWGLRLWRWVHGSDETAPTRACAWCGMGALPLPRAACATECTACATCTAALLPMPTASWDAQGAEWWTHNLHGVLEFARYFGVPALAVYVARRCQALTLLPTHDTLLLARALGPDLELYTVAVPTDSSGLRVRPGVSDVVTQALATLAPAAPTRTWEGLETFAAHAAHMACTRRCALTLDVAALGTPLDAAGRVAALGFGGVVVAATCADPAGDVNDTGGCLGRKRRRPAPDSGGESGDTPATATRGVTEDADAWATVHTVSMTVADALGMRLHTHADTVLRRLCAACPSLGTPAGLQALLQAHPRAVVAGAAVACAVSAHPTRHAHSSSRADVWVLSGTTTGTDAHGADSADEVDVRAAMGLPQTPAPPLPCTANADANANANANADADATARCQTRLHVGRDRDAVAAAAAVLHHATAATSAAVAAAAAAAEAEAGATALRPDCMQLKAHAGAVTLGGPIGDVWVCHARATTPSQLLADWDLPHEQVALRFCRVRGRIVVEATVAFCAALADGVVRTWQDVWSTRSRLQQATAHAGFELSAELRHRATLGDLSTDSIAVAEREATRVGGFPLSWHGVPTPPHWWVEPWAYARLRPGQLDCSDGGGVRRCPERRRWWTDPRADTTEALVDNNDTWVRASVGRVFLRHVRLRRGVRADRVCVTLAATSAEGVALRALAASLRFVDAALRGSAPAGASATAGAAGTDADAEVPVSFPSDDVNLVVERHFCLSLTDVVLVWNGATGSTLNWPQIPLPQEHAWTACVLVEGRCACAVSRRCGGSGNGACDGACDSSGNDAAADVCLTVTQIALFPPAFLTPGPFASPPPPPVCQEPPRVPRLHG